MHVSRLKRAVWRRSKPEGYKESRLVQGEDGAWYRDMEYEGETAWQDTPGGGGQAEAVEERVPSGERPEQRGTGEEMKVLTRAGVRAGVQEALRDRSGCRGKRGWLSGMLC